MSIIYFLGASCTGKSMLANAFYARDNYYKHVSFDGIFDWGTKNIDSFLEEFGRITKYYENILLDGWYPIDNIFLCNIYPGTLLYVLYDDFDVILDNIERFRPNDFSLFKNRALEWQDEWRGIYRQAINSNENRIIMKNNKIVDKNKIIKDLSL